jgi:hypothetical protein
MSSKQRICLTVMSLIVAGATLSVGTPVAAAAQEDVYPWCTQGSVLHCYYPNREQCEETVDYHGFCVENPDIAGVNHEEGAQ